MTFRNVRVIANANNKELRTVHVYDAVTGQTGQFEQCTQIGPTSPNGNWETVQNVTVPTAGVKNIIIDGYTAPN